MRKILSKIWKKLHQWNAPFDIVPNIFNNLDEKKIPVLIVMNNEDSFLVGKFLNSYYKFNVCWIELELLDQMQIKVSQNGEAPEPSPTITINVSHISYLCPKEELE